jgi:hypothetical protein
MCDCYRIGGPFIAEDPNCPAHGTEARRKHRAMYELRTSILRANDIEYLKELMIKLLDLFEE